MTVHRQLITKPFRIDAYRYMRAIAELWCGRWWWTLLLPVLVCFSLALTLNVAFFFLAFILVFIILPMLMLFLYYYYALTPTAIAAVREKQIIIDNGKSITVEFTEPTNSGHIPNSLVFTWNDITAAEFREHDVMVHLSGSNYNFILIPFESLANDNDMQMLSAIFSNSNDFIQNQTPSTETKNNKTYDI